MSVLRQGIVLLAAGGLIAGGGIQARDHLHIGAPPLVITCPKGDTPVYHWEKGTRLAGQPGTVTYHGWVKWGSCADSLDASTGG